MASPNDGQRVAANWQAVVSTTPEDQIHGDYWLFNRMSAGNGFKGLSGGDSITGPIEYALNTTVQSYSDTDTFSTTRVDVFDRYEYDWKEYVGVIVMSELEKDRNAGEGELFALAPAKMENLRMSLRGTMNADAFGDGTGNGGKAVEGLQKLVAGTPTSGTVGGINRANFSFFRNQTLDDTGSSFSTLRASMRSVYNLCSNGVGDQHPTFAVTDRASFEGYEGTLTTNERFTSKAEGDGGFKNEVLKFKGALISYDNACLAATMYFLNERFYKWVYKTGSWMKARPAINPANQTVDIVAIRTMFNTIATAPRRLGVITTIA